jgi:hypothetical protein
MHTIRVGGRELTLGSLLGGADDSRAVGGVVHQKIGQVGPPATSLIGGLSAEMNRFVPARS